MKKKYIYYCSIERFGYFLECIGFTEEEVKMAIIEEYIKAYKNRNGIDPREDDDDCYETFLEELPECIDKREINKVEWR